MSLMFRKITPIVLALLSIACMFSSCSGSDKGDDLSGPSTVSSEAGYSSEENVSSSYSSLNADTTSSEQSSTAGGKSEIGSNDTSSKSVTSFSLELPDDIW